MEKFLDIVILCVGTNKIVGDSVGPIVGKKLTRLLKHKENVKIYGNTKKNLNLKNAKHVLEEISCIQPEPLIITIDAALGPKEMIETVFMTTGKIKIGEALGNGMGYNSHINIKGIVGECQESSKENFEVLNKVHPKCIHRLSNKITYEICQLIEKINDV